jgi:hypothetical protein
MASMHKDYAYQFFDFTTYKELRKLKYLKQTKTCGGIEPQFYEEP